MWLQKLAVSTMRELPLSFPNCSCLYHEHALMCRLRVVICIGCIIIICCRGTRLYNIHYYLYIKSPAHTHTHIQLILSTNQRNLICTKLKRQNNNNKIQPSNKSNQRGERLDGCKNPIVVHIIERRPENLRLFHMASQFICLICRF